MIAERCSRKVSGADLPGVEGAEQKSKEALELVQRKHNLVKWEDERERARILQSGSRQGPKVVLLWPRLIVLFLLDFNGVRRG